MRIKVGIIGLGNLGLLHAKHLRYRIPNAELIAICARKKEKSEKLKEQLAVPYAYTSLEEMCKNPELDAIVITSATKVHCEQIKTVISAGLHVFVEKPTGANSEECIEIEKVLKKSDKKFMVGFMRRFDPTYVDAKKRIEAGEIGKPLFFRGYSLDAVWFGKDQTERVDGNGCWFMDMGVHDYDLARWFLGSEGDTVFTCGDAYKFPVFKEYGDVDNGFSLMKFKNNSAAFFYVGRTAPHGSHCEGEIIGTDGMLRLCGEPTKNYLKSYTKNGVEATCVEDFIERWSEAFYLEMQHFIDCIQNDKNPMTTAFDGTMATKMGEACVKAFNSGELQKV